MRPLSQGVIIAGSAVCTALTVANAFLVNKQFYPAIVYLTRSSASLAVIYVQSLVLVYLIFQLLRRVFFGDLRASESEHLSERAWHAVMETCLAFTVFRDDFSPIFVMQFVLLLFVKAFHWLADDRVDLMERSPVLSLKFHIRMLSIAAFLTALDSHFVSHAYSVTLNKGASAQVVFGFEYAILMTLVLQVAIKYVLHMHDLRSATPWEGKSLWLLHAELAINAIRCLLYFMFMVIMLRVHTLPLFSIRPFYISLRAFHKALNDVILSRRAVHAMNNRFPVVTEEELAAMDATCIICREEMTSVSSPKRLPCSHVFHAHCLRSWFQRQQTCPTCRTDILSNRAQTNPAAALRAAAQAAAAGAQAAHNVNGGAAPGAQGVPIFPFVAHQFAFPVPRQPDVGAPPVGGQPPAGLPPPPPPFPFPGGLPAGFPPFPGMGGFPGFPGFPPPPPPPFPLPPRPSTVGLSDEELRQLEGTTRSALEARIRVLGDIATLLDAAVIQMQQYSSIVPAIPTVPTVETETAPETPPEAAPAQEEERAEEESPGTSGLAGEAPTEETRGGEEEREEAGGDVNEIRQRRLQHLGEL